MPVSTAIERPALINQGAIHTSRFLEYLNFLFQFLFNNISLLTCLMPSTRRQATIKFINAFTQIMNVAVM